MLAEEASCRKALNSYGDLYLAGQHDVLCSEIKGDTDYWRGVVIERNKKWRKRMEELPKTPGALIAVGVAHTCGTDSIIDLMRKDGFRITRRL